MQIGLFLILILVSGVSSAQSKYSADAGIGFTDNANFESQNKDNDVILNAKVQATGQLDKNQFGLRLSYRDYLNQSANDNLAWRIYDQWIPSETSWAYTGAFVGRHYTTGSPGFTDTSFSNLGWDFTAEQMRELNSTNELTYGPGARGRYYSGSADRSDHQVYGFIDFSREQSSKLNLGASAELAYLKSSNNLYNQFGFDLSGSTQYALETDLHWYNEMFYGTTSFSDRTIDVVTVVTKRRGTVQKTTSKETESFTIFGLSSEVVKRLNGIFDGRMGLTHTTQSSKSGTQSYSVNEIYMSLTGRF